jgi:hypothetical protein
VLDGDVACCAKLGDLSPIQRSLRIGRKGLDQSDRAIGCNGVQILIPEIAASDKRRKPFRGRRYFRPQCQHLPATCRADRCVDGDTREIDGIRMNPVVDETGLIVAIASRRSLDIGMALRSNQLPSTGFALEIDGRIKTEFDTREGAESGVIALKRRFPHLQVRVYDASTKTRHEVQA